MAFEKITDMSIRATSLLNEQLSRQYGPEGTAPEATGVVTGAVDTTPTPEATPLDDLSTRASNIVAEQLKHQYGGVPTPPPPPPPSYVADFTWDSVAYPGEFINASPLSNMNQPVQFTDTSTGEGPITSWEWDFGDGSAHEHTHVPAPHTFPTAADGVVYYPKLTINGGAASTEKALEIFFPFAWYKGENNANDVFGNNGNWQVTPQYATGKVGQAFKFAYDPTPDGRGAITIPYNAVFNLSPTGNWAIRCWLRPLDNSNYGFMFAKGLTGFPVGGGIDYALGIDDKKIKIWTGNAYLPMLGPAGAILKDTWYDIIWNYSNGISQLYIDGTERTLTPNNLSISQSTNKQFICFHKYGPKFNARIDEIKLYHRNITPQD